MYALIRPFLELCWLRSGPQHLPTSTLLMELTLTAHALAAFLLSLAYLAPARALAAGLAETALLAVFVTIVLYLPGHLPRYRQTLTALAGTGAMLSLLAIPVTHWLHTAKAAADPTGAPALLLLGLVGWSLAITAHILRHALNCVFTRGLVLAVVFSWLSIIIMNQLFPLAS